MRLHEVFAQPNTIITESARIQHAEDIIFWEGSAGALRAVSALRSLADRGHQDVTIKWDGCVHPETVLFTDQGEQTIMEVIDRFERYPNQQIKVLGSDLTTGAELMVPVNMAGHKPGAKKWVTIHLEDGGKITLTEDHEVHTSNRGWVQAKDLTEEDDITEITKK